VRVAEPHQVPVVAPDRVARGGGLGDPHPVLALGPGRAGPPEPLAEPRPVPALGLGQALPGPAPGGGRAQEAARPAGAGPAAPAGSNSNGIGGDGPSVAGPSSGMVAWASLLDRAQIALKRRAFRDAQRQAEALLQAPMPRDMRGRALMVAADAAYGAGAF